MSEEKVPEFSKVAVPVESGAQLYRASLYFTRKGVNQRDIHFVITQEAHHTEYVREKYIAEGAIVGPNLRVEFAESKCISLELPSVDVILNHGWKIIPLTPPEITKEVVDSYNFETGWGIPSCQLIALWTAQSRPSQLIHTVTLKGTKKPSYFSIVLDSDSISLASRAPTPNMRKLMDSLYHTVADKWEHIGIYLHLPMPTLKVIATEHQRDPHKCLIGMLEAWLKRVDPPPTWSAISEAVEFLGEEQLATQLREKYMAINL